LRSGISSRLFIVGRFYTLIAKSLVSIKSLRCLLISSLTMNSIIHIAMSKKSMMKLSKTTTRIAKEALFIPLYSILSLLAPVGIAPMYGLAHMTTA